jgi:hypothetical protein
MATTYRNLWSNGGVIFEIRSRKDRSFIKWIYPHLAWMLPYDKFFEEKLDNNYYSTFNAEMPCNDDLDEMRAKIMAQRAIFAKHYKSDGTVKVLNGVPYRAVQPNDPPRPPGRPPKPAKVPKPPGLFEPQIVFHASYKRKRDRF